MPIASAYIESSAGATARQLEPLVSRYSEPAAASSPSAGRVGVFLRPPSKHPECNEAVGSYDQQFKPRDWRDPNRQEDANIEVDDGAQPREVWRDDLLAPPLPVPE